MTRSQLRLSIEESAARLLVALANGDRAEDMRQHAEDILAEVNRLEEMEAADEYEPNPRPGLSVPAGGIRSETFWR